YATLHSFHISQNRRLSPSRARMVAATRRRSSPAPSTRPLASSCLPKDCTASRIERSEPSGMSDKFDVIVAGVGGMGAAACYHLAKRGKRVLGLERYGIPHAMGSSHGVNRIIRLAYYEDPSYVPLLRRAFELWRELGRDFGEQVLYVTGSIDT